MLKNRHIAGLIFPLFLLGALLLQSVHGFHHLEKFSTEKHCLHRYDHQKTEIGHTHHDLEHCFICEFTFYAASKSDFLTFNFKEAEIPVSYSFFFSKEITQSFRGSLFALRAPPIFIV